MAWRRWIPIAAMIGLVVALPLGASAQADGGLRLSTPYPGIGVDPGRNASFAIRLESDTSRVVDLSVEGLPEGWTATFKGGGSVVSSVTVGADVSPDVRLDVSVPSDAEDGSRTVTVRASSGSVTAGLDVTVLVQGGASGSVSLVPEFPGLRGAASATFTFNVTARNDTAEDVALDLTAEGPPGWRVDAKPSAQSQASTVSIASGSSQRITVTARPPVDVDAGTYDLSVAATGAGVEAVTPLTVQIVGDYSLTVTTGDQRLNADVSAGSPGVLTLVVVNTGTAPLVGVDLRATPPRDWSVEFDPPAIDQLGPGQSAQVTATITPSADALAGDYDVGVRASTDQAQSSVDIRATVSPSTVWGLVGVGVIALTLGGLWGVFRRFGRR